MHLDATEHEDSIVFLHHVKEGAANKSYGLQVAKLAGVPIQVIENAKTKLFELENKNASDETNPESNQTMQKSQGNAPASNYADTQIIQADLFAGANSKVEQLVRDTDIDDLSPRQAQDLLYELKSLIQ